MKSTLLILALAIPFFLSAQMGTDVLFTQGAELEYKTMSARSKGFKLELYETTRITLKVDRVVDSEGVKYSFITKTGKGIEKPDRDFYSRKIMLTKEEDKIILPADLYVIDTAYLADKYPEAKKAKGYTAVTKMDGKTYIYTDKENSRIDYFPKVMETTVYIRDVVTVTPTGARSVTDNYESLQEFKYTMKISIGSLKFETGTKKISTAAGSFDCFIMRSKASLDGMGRKMEQESLVYFHPQIGFIKTEQVDAKQPTGSVELVRVKIPGK